MHGRLRASLRKDEPSRRTTTSACPYHPSNDADVQPLVAGRAHAAVASTCCRSRIVFKAGHRIRLLLTFADAVTPRLRPPPKVTLYRDAAHPSALTLPIIPH